MPIEQAVHCAGDNTTLASKLLYREEYWIRELHTIYHMALMIMFERLVMFPNVVVWWFSLFNKHVRKFKKKRNKQKNSKVFKQQVLAGTRDVLLSYGSPEFGKKFRSFVMSLPKRKLCDVLWVSEELLLENKIPSRVAMLVRDVVYFRKSKDDNM